MIVIWNVIISCVIIGIIMYIIIFIFVEGTCALIKSNVMCINIRDTRRLKLEKLGECVSNRYEVNVDTGKEI